MPIPQAQELFRPNPENVKIQARVADILDGFLTETMVSSSLPDSELEKAFAKFELPEKSTRVVDYFAELADGYIPQSSHTSSPRSFAHMTSSVPLFMQQLGALVIGMNQNLVKQDASRALTCIERQTLAMLHRLAFGASDDFYRRHTHAAESSLGIVSSGSTLANIIAIWCARNARLPQAVETGEWPGRCVVLGSRLMHYSFAKAADLLGLGKQALIELPVDAACRVDLVAMRDEIARCRERNWTILAIVGVAGTTDAGSIDPLPELADICMAENVHFHVDAAWGGPLLFSTQHRSKLVGIERADSITFDGHKQLHLPMGMGMVLFRRPDLAKAIEKDAPYLIRAGSSDLGRRALEGSRAGSVLYLHAALHIFGRQGYEALVDEGMALSADCAAELASAAAFELLAPPELRVLVYRYIPAQLRERVGTGSLGEADNQAIDDLNRRLYATQKADGQTLVSMTTLPTRYGDRVCLRAVIANPTATLADFRQVLAHQEELGRSLETAP